MLDGLSPRTAMLVLLAPLGYASACAVDPNLGEAASGSSPASSGSVSSSSVTSGSVTSGSGSGGSGGQGGMASFCVAGSHMPCYSGPPSTQGVGVCKPGVQTCDLDGAAYGPCEGEVTPLPENCATAADDDCDGAAPACTGACLWSQRFGDDAFQEGRSIVVDGNGDLIVAGSFQGTIDLGGGPLVSAGKSDIFLAKLSPGGGHVWSQRFGNAEDQTVSAATVDAEGNVTLTGIIHGMVGFGGAPLAGDDLGDAFIAKLSPDGDHLWSKRFGSELYQEGLSVVAAGRGEVVVSGRFNGLIDFGGGPLFGDGFVVKLGPSGEHVWSRALCTYMGCLPLSLAVDAAGRVAVAGAFLGDIDFPGGLKSSAGFSYDSFVLMLDADGQSIWGRTFGDSAFQDIQSVALDAAGNAFVTGRFLGTVDLGGGPLASAGDSDAFLAKYDPAGAHLWSKTFGDAKPQTGRAVAVDAFGNVAVTGDFGGAVDLGGGPLASIFGQDVFLAKYDPAGAHLWSRRYGDANEQIPQGMAVDGAGDVLVTGKFMNKIDFCGSALVSAGERDVFIAKIAP